MAKFTIDRESGIAYFRGTNHQLCLFVEKFSCCL